MPLGFTAVEDHWLDWFGRHTPDWLETLIRCTGIHNYLTSRTFTPLEKQFLANGLRFIPTPSPSQLEMFTSHFRADATRGMQRFARTLALRLKHSVPEDDDRSEHIPKFVVRARHHRADPFTDDERADLQRQLFHLNQYRAFTERALDQALAHHESLALVRQQRLNSTRDDRTFVHRLIDDPLITCKPADKNLGLVLVDTSWYDAELKRMLADQTTYKKFDGTFVIKAKTIKGNSTKLKEHLYDELQRIVKHHAVTLRLWNEDAFKQIEKYMRNKIGKSTSAIPEIYLLIKVHKPKGLCGRPIVPCTRWITTPASVLVDHLLQEIVKKANIPWLVKDTKSFVNELEHKRVHQRDGVFVTADIASLYTNIDTNAGLELVEQFLCEQSVDPDHTKLIMDLLSFVMRHSYLTFKGQTFHQIDGTAMGTAAAPIYANIVVYQWEKQTVHEFTEASSLYLYRRFLDDIFAYIRACDVDRFMTRMNQLHPKLVFEFASHESEAAFLDLSIFKGDRFHRDGRFDLRVHQKKMNLYLYIPYLSFHTDAAKRSFIQTELMRYIRNSSDQQDYNSLKAIFYGRLRDRGYPHAFLKPLFESIYYADREYFLLPSAEQLAHPELKSRPPLSTCLLKRIARASTAALWTPGLTTPPPVFIVPYTPLSRVIPTRQILSQHWDIVHTSVVPSPRPIIAYQSYPSLLTQLIFTKAKRMEEARVAKTLVPSTTQLKLTAFLIDRASSAPTQ